MSMAESLPTGLRAIRAMSARRATARMREAGRDHQGASDMRVGLALLVCAVLTAFLHVLSAHWFLSGLAALP